MFCCCQPELPGVYLKQKCAPVAARKQATFSEASVPARWRKSLRWTEAGRWSIVLMLGGVRPPILGGAVTSAAWRRPMPRFANLGCCNAQRGQAGSYSGICDRLSRWQLTCDFLPRSCALPIFPSYGLFPASNACEPHPHAPRTATAGLGNGRRPPTPMPAAAHACSHPPSWSQWRTSSSRRASRKSVTIASP